MSSAEIVNSAMAFRSSCLSIVYVGSGSVRQLGLGRGETKRKRTVDDLVTNRNCEPAEQLWVDGNLRCDRMAVDPAQHFGEAGVLGVAEFSCCAYLRDDLAPSSHRDFGQALHGDFGRLSAEQLDCLGEQLSRDLVDAVAGASEDVA